MKKTVKNIIDKAEKALGGQKAVAEKMGIDRSRVSQWKNGHTRIQPGDLAAISFLGGGDAMETLARATIESNLGTTKGELLKRALAASAKRKKD